ncbi:MAG: hypothetical protein V4635_06280 [Bacteroidota bacterium]
METNDKTFADKLINGLKAAATELEELQVQISLGKAETRAVFEELKYKFNGRLGEIKARYATLKTNRHVVPLVNALENVQVQMALGIAETKDMFEKQLKKINGSLNVLESELKNQHLLPGHTAEVQLEIEKFKAKLELIRLHFKLKKVTMEYNFGQKLAEFHRKVDLLRVKVSEEKNDVKNKWNFFKTEIDEAYTHLKNAFTQ